MIELSRDRAYQLTEDISTINEHLLILRSLMQEQLKHGAQKFYIEVSRIRVGAPVSELEVSERTNHIQSTQIGN